MTRSTTMLLIALAGCGRIGFEPVDAGDDGSPDVRAVDAFVRDAGENAASDAASDAGTSDAMPDIQVSDGGSSDVGADSGPDAGPIRFGPFEPATEETILNGTHDHAPTVTEDLLELFYESIRGGEIGLYRSRRATPEDPWSPPTPVAELNGVGSISGPSISPDGLTMWFVAERPGGIRLNDVWVTTRVDRDSPFQPPTLVPELSSSANEHRIMVDSSLLRCIVHTGQTGNGDLYLGTRPSVDSPWTSFEPLEFNTDTFNDAGGQLDSQGNLFFASDRDDAVGGSDLFFAPATDVGFGPIQRITELSGAGREEQPWVSADGTYIIFSIDKLLYSSRRARL